MIKALLCLVLVVFFLGCSMQEEPMPENSVSSISELVLTPIELSSLGMVSNGTDCQIEAYETGNYSSLAEYGICFYTLTDDNTEVIIQLQKFTNQHDLNGSYQYSSSHLRSSEGLISENTFGDQSRFSVNSEYDYGGEFNDPNIFYYHLWFSKELYLVHVTSKGSEDAKEDVLDVGSLILEKI